MMGIGGSPSYDQSVGPNFIPIGNEEDLRQAAKIAGSSKLYAALRPTEDTIRKAVNVEYWFSWLWMPWNWIFIPCAIPCIMNREAELRHNLYVITEDSIFISVDDYSPPCACGCTTGRDSCEISFDSITDITVDNRGKGCTCCRIPHVTISLVSKQVMLLVENTEGVAHLIRELRRASKERLRGPAIMAQPSAVIQEPPQTAAPQGKRIFVAKSDTPTAFTIVNLRGDSAADWEHFVDTVRNALGYPEKARIHLTLADIDATVSGPDQLSSNDKIIATLH